MLIFALHTLHIHACCMHKGPYHCQIYYMTSTIIVCTDMLVTLVLGLAAFNIFISTHTIGDTTSIY